MPADRPTHEAKVIEYYEQAEKSGLSDRVKFMWADCAQALPLALARKIR